jgi:hypothetical protein
VSGGVAIGAATGTAVITVTTKDGNKTASATITVTAAGPTLAAPTNLNVQVVYDGAYVTWASSASSFELQLGASTHVYYASTLSYSFEALDSETSYTWKVRAKSAETVSDWASSSFTTTAAPPAAAPVITPSSATQNADGSWSNDCTGSNATQLRIQWDEVAGATGYYVSKDGGEPTTNTSRNTWITESGTYTVTAFNEGGVLTESATIAVSLVECLPPAPVFKGTPATANTCPATFTTLEVNRIPELPGIVKYTLYKDGSTVVNTITPADENSQVKFTITESGAYTVKSAKANNLESDPSETVNVTISAPCPTDFANITINDFLGEWDVTGKDASGADWTYTVTIANEVLADSSPAELAYTVDISNFADKGQGGATVKAIIYLGTNYKTDRVGRLNIDFDDYGQEVSTYGGQAVSADIKKLNVGNGTVVGNTSYLDANIVADPVNGTKLYFIFKTGFVILDGSSTELAKSAYTPAANLPAFTKK